MIFISHRGCIVGPNPQRENSLSFIYEAIQAGYDVEIDLWMIDDHLWLGHDAPTYPVNFAQLDSLRDRLWCHAKNVETITPLISEGYHCFWHQEDDVTLTSKNYIWTFPGRKIITDAIAVMPERVPDWDILQAGGICSDYIERYKQQHESSISSSRES